MWIGLTAEEKSKVMLDSRDSATTDYYECKHNHTDNTLDIVEYDPYDMYSFPLFYSLDLKTLKPNENSLHEIILSDNLCKEIEMAYPFKKLFRPDYNMDKESFIAAMKEHFGLPWRPKQKHLWYSNVC